MLTLGSGFNYYFCAEPVTATEAEWEYVPNAETRAAIEECENGAELETLDIANFKDYVKSL